MSDNSPMGAHCKHQRRHTGFVPRHARHTHALCVCFDADGTYHHASMHLSSHSHGPTADNAALCLQVSPELGNSYSDVLAAQDVALYGGLCALASFDRSEIKRHVVESIGFREMLELNPEVETTPASLSQCHAEQSQPEPVHVRIVSQRHT